MDQGGTGRDARQRYTVTEAAQALGLSVDAVRSRIKRDTIAHEHVGRRVYVLLDADQGRPGRDQGSDQDAGKPTEDRTAELIATLREQLQAERQAHAEARRIIAGLVERIPALEAPESPEPGEEEGDRGTGPAPEEQPADRPWWRRVLGG